MGMTLKPKPNRINGSVQKCKDRKKYVKFGQIWRFCSLFSSITIAYCIMNSCHKVVRSIRYTTLKLWAFYTKQFVRKAQNLHHNNAPAHTSGLVREFLARNKTVIMPQPPHSPDLAPAGFFLFPRLKTPTKGKRFARVEERKEKSIKELLAVPQSAFQKCFKDWKKRWHKRIISEEVYV